jgi:hypothetical protein
MDLKTANTAINVAIETANGLGVKFCIAVMDSGVYLGPSEVRATSGQHLGGHYFR